MTSTRRLLAAARQALDTVLLSPVSTLYTDSDEQLERVLAAIEVFAESADRNQIAWREADPMRSDAMWANLDEAAKAQVACEAKVLADLLTSWPKDELAPVGLAAASLAMQMLMPRHTTSA